MSASKKKDPIAQEDKKTMIVQKFFRFVGEKRIEKGEPAAILEDSNQEVTTRFDRAKVVLTSNPFYDAPIEALQSMESVIRIKNDNEVRDQLR